MPAMTHGHSAGGVRTPEYQTWRHMKTRCYNPRSKDFKNYGGRGIAICERWRDDYAAFLADVGQRPSPKHSIDRIDNARGYEPGNVRWATKREQNRNTRQTKLTAADAEAILCLLDDGIQQRAVAARYGISQRLVMSITTGEAWADVLAAHAKKPDGDKIRAERHLANLAFASNRMWREMSADERCKRMAAVRAGKAQARRAS